MAEPSPSPESFLNGFVRTLKDAEDRYRYCVTVAKELKNSNAHLSQSLTAQRTLNSSLKAELSALSNDYDTLQSSHNGLVASKETLESNINDLTNTVKTATEMIGVTVKKLRKLEEERNTLAARVETLEFDLAASDEFVEVLQEELVKTKAAHDLDASKFASEENERKAMQFKDLNTNEKTSTSSTDQMQSLQASIDRLQRKYDRLVTKKEAAEQRFYASYVDWHNFKGWWTGFSKFPGISRRILTYNREVKNGTWILNGGQALGAGEKGRVLRVIEAAEQDPKAFPNVVGDEEDLQMETDQKAGSRDQLEDVSGMEDAKQKLERVCREAQEICGSTTTTIAAAQGVPTLIPYQTSPTEGDATLIASVQRPVVGKENEQDTGKEDSLDPDKTQETTPASSQAPPFILDLSGLKQPYMDLYSPAIRPILERPRLLSPEPSQVIVIKDESQDPDSLLRPMSTTTISPAPLASTSKLKHLATTIKSSKPTTPSTTSKPKPFTGSVPAVPPPLAPPSTLGKRKAPIQEQTPAAEGSRRTGRVPLQLQLVDGTPVTTSISSTKRRRGLDDDDGMESPSVRSVPGKGNASVTEGSESRKKPDKGDTSTTLNALYEINPARNGGLNFAYHETERRKAERKKMEAGSCADCIEYYRVVGPMPPRAGPPLWKSPTSSPQGAKTSRPGCKCSNDKGRGDEEEVGEVDIAAHQQQISRHRHHFPAARTPPRYWDVGFPDTQQVKEINEMAEEMHEHKERGMEMEARKPDGKYRRR